MTQHNAYENNGIYAKTPYLIFTVACTLSFGSSLIRNQSAYIFEKIEETAVPTACVRKLSDWNRGLPRSFLAHIASLQLKSICEAHVDMLPVTKTGFGRNLNLPTHVSSFLGGGQDGYPLTSLHT